MPNERFSGGIFFFPSSMHSPSIEISPCVIGIRPAMQLSAVDFPQPEGPRKVMNSPLATSRENRERAVFPSNSLVRSLTMNLLNSFMDTSFERGRRKLTPD